MFKKLWGNLLTNDRLKKKLSNNPKYYLEIA